MHIDVQPGIVYQQVIQVGLMELLEDHFRSFHHRSEAVPGAMTDHDQVAVADLKCHQRLGHAVQVYVKFNRMETGLLNAQISVFFTVKYYLRADGMVSGTGSFENDEAFQKLIYKTCR